MHCRLMWCSAFAFGVLIAGCASSQSADDRLSADSIPFREVKAAPESYRGQSVVFGGEVLSAKRLKDATRIEILHLPLDGAGRPVIDRTQSQGRFMAMHREFLDPATLPPGTRLTITGEVAGAMTLPLDETEYTYPVIEARRIDVSPASDLARPWRQPYPYMGRGPFWGPYGGPYGGPWPYR